MLWLHTNDRLAIIIFEIQCGNVKKKKKSKISGTSIYQVEAVTVFTLWFNQNLHQSPNTHNVNSQFTKI